MLRADRSTHRTAFCLAGVTLLILASHWASGEQNSHTLRKHPSACLDSFELNSLNGPQYRAVRVMPDRGTGHRWLLVQQVDRPEIPARLVQIPADHACIEALFESSNFHSSSGLQDNSRPVIQTGESVVVSERTSRLDARLDAIALQPAAAGAALYLRLKLDGHILRAVATAPGRATISVERSWVQQ